MKSKELSGQRFHSLVAIEVAEKIGYRNKWKCICDCGNISYVSVSKLINGTTKSCGCYNARVVAERSTTHGQTIGRKSTPEYNSWQNMKERCSNKKSKSFKDYGGRGITVCDEWVTDFNRFLSDVGIRPSNRHTLGRKDNDKGYFKENCEWQTPEVQMRNKRNNVWIEAQGTKMILSDWAKQLRLEERFIMRFLKKGMSLEEIVAYSKSNKYFKEKVLHSKKGTIYKALFLTKKERDLKKNKISIQARLFGNLI